ncbi:MAG TPA: dUTP diphosphatase [Candidatus Cloacimonetes bacterium]|nr:dUTP diphosphatase [Candidatus Cloacimonadota bacterium]
MIELKIRKLHPSAKLPQKMTEHAAGYDLYSANSDDVILKPGKIELIPTGIAISLPPDYEAQIRPRSGLATNHLIGVLNSPGTIDADYRGEIKVILFNFGKKNFVIKPHTRISQMVISKYENVNFIETEILDDTKRGIGGFGHTEY